MTIRSPISTAKIQPREKVIITNKSFTRLRDLVLDCKDPLKYGQYMDRDPPKAHRYAAFQNKRDKKKSQKLQENNKSRVKSTCKTMTLKTIEHRAQILKICANHRSHQGRLVQTGKSLDYTAQEETVCIHSKHRSKEQRPVPG